MPRTPFRLLASFVLVLAASAQLGALVHLAVVPHVRCEAHGAIEHGGDLEHDVGAHDGATDAGDHAHDALAADADHAHETCGALAMRDERAILDAIPHLALAAPRASPSIDDAPAALRLASRALDLAPKTSPPA